MTYNNVNNIASHLVGAHKMCQRFVATYTVALNIAFTNENTLQCLVKWLKKQSVND